MPNQGPVINFDDVLWQDMIQRRWRVAQDEIPPQPADPAPPLRRWVRLADAAEQLAPAPKNRDLPNDKELWDRLIAAVREIYEPEYVCVAGGAVRDYFMGKPPKDIDIFVKMPKGAYPTKKLLEDAQCLGWKNPAFVGHPGKYGHQQKKVVIGGEVLGYRAEIIFGCGEKPPANGREIVDGFDFTICQHWYDGEIHSLPEAKYAIQKKLWTPVKGLKLDKVLREHYNRVNNRHGGIYKLDEGEPWYAKFNNKAKIA